MCAALFRVIFVSIIAFSFVSPVSHASDIENWRSVLHDVSDFESKNISHFASHDFSRLISNRDAAEQDPMSSYEGVFGPRYRRIDFYIQAKRESEQRYQITGKSRLGKIFEHFPGTPF